MREPSSWTDFAPSPESLRPGKRWSVFLSYRSVNRPWVLNLYDVLRQHGHTVFLDQVALIGGQQLISELSRNLSESQAAVLIWSKAAADSAWVLKEYEKMESMATKEPDFSFVPLRLDDSELPGFAPSRVFFDFTDYPDGPNGGELMRLLHAVVGKPLSEQAARFAAQQDVLARTAAAQIAAAIDTGNGDRLVQLYEAGGLIWETTSVLGCRAAEGLTKLKQYQQAIEMLEKIENRFPMAVRPKQLRALALARRGAPGDLDEAQQILGALRAEGHRDPETLGIYGRTWMDRYALSGNILDLKKSRDLYAEAFEYARDDYYTGINAAAKSILIGTPEEIATGKQLAEKVELIVGTESKRGDYWHNATVGEVQLLLGNYAAAAARYEDAVVSAPTERGSHETSWKQICRLLRKLEPTDEERALLRQPFQHLPDCDDMLAGEQT